MERSEYIILFPRIPAICEYAMNISEYIHSYLRKKKFEYPEFIRVNIRCFVFQIYSRIPRKYSIKFYYNYITFIWNWFKETNFLFVKRVQKCKVPILLIQGTRLF